ncbi:Hypothetical predicted protein [Mytilus galloprovincialis]|uniref:Uncharacterized protein n=1 Tax=Mytilus galloprovincialis TaxID=29158 RepID=A0A8B6DA34_MYTGA|nr:Hypothetical predicted protein [Mytilus galloprovincialis]
MKNIHGLETGKRSYKVIEKKVGVSQDDLDQYDHGNLIDAISDDSSSAELDTPDDSDSDVQDSERKTCYIGEVTDGSVKDKVEEKEYLKTTYHKRKKKRRLNGEQFIGDSVTSQRSRNRGDRTIHWIFYCNWTHSMKEAEIGPEDAHYAWPNEVLKNLRSLVPFYVKREIKKDAFKVSIGQFCEVVGRKNDIMEI